MARNLAVNDKVTVRIYCTAEGQTAVNIRHGYISAIAGGAYTDADMAEDLAATFADPYKACIGAIARYEGCSVQVYDPDLFLSQFSSSNAGVGAGAGDLLPTQVCGLIKTQSNFGGRRGRGRIYVPFPTESMNDADGDPSDLYRVSLVDIADLMVGTFTGAAGVNSATLTWVVSRSGLGALRPVLTYDIRTKWAIQRRRGENRGGDAPIFT